MDVNSYENLSIAFVLAQKSSDLQVLLLRPDLEPYSHILVKN